ncbi:MAG: metallophosphoesterase family protein [Gemmataceae bacterium]|nr:metallophosphoesterase family protein [Gemmataceae bacterium]
MRIGLVTDIHDQVELLAAALAELRAAGVDAVVTLGDTTDFFGKWNTAREVAALRRAAGAVGVWGNHDAPLCRHVTEDIRARFLSDTCDYFASLQPRLELGGCHFSHIEPFLNPESPADLWTFEGRPEDDERVAKSFAAFTHRAAFTGHYHRWLALTEQGKVDWGGTEPLHFEEGKRYLVVVAPVFRGTFAVLDTDSWLLTPRQLS